MIASGSQAQSIDFLLKGNGSHGKVAIREVPESRVTQPGRDHYCSLKKGCLERMQVWERVSLALRMWV